MKDEEPTAGPECQSRNGRKNDHFFLLCVHGVNLFSRPSSLLKKSRGALGRHAERPLLFQHAAKLRYTFSYSVWTVPPEHPPDRPASALHDTTEPMYAAARDFSSLDTETAAWFHDLCVV